MAREFDPSKHPGDRPGAYQRAVVVCVKDPENRGRVQCRINGLEDDLMRIPDKNLVWTKVQGTNDSAGMQTSTGGQHGLLAGSMVELSMYGPANQDRVVRGTIPNDVQGGNQTKHPAEDGQDKVFPDEDRHSKKYGWSKPLAQIYDIKTTQEARQMRDGEDRHSRMTKEPIEESKSKSKTLKAYKERPNMRDA